MVQNWSEGEEICRTYALPVKIEDGVWIGGGAILLPGVIIGRNSVIGRQRCHPFHPCQLCGGGQSLPCNQNRLKVMRKYKHIIFDIDGTLIDTEEAILQSLQDTVHEKYCIKTSKSPN